MTERPLDAERVAAFLDGRLSPTERLQVMSQIADDPDWREVLVDAAAVIADASTSADAGAPESKNDSQDVTVSDINVRRPQAPAARHWKPMLLAATLLIAVGVSTWQLALRPRSSKADVLMVASQNVSTLSVSGDAIDSRWPRVRSASAPASLTQNATGVRAGILAVDIIALNARHDSTIANDLRTELTTLLQSTPGSGASLGALRDARATSEFETAFRSIRDLVGPIPFDAGVWLELARRSSDKTLRARPEFASAVTKLVELPGYDAQVVQLARQVVHGDQRAIDAARGELGLDSLMLAITR